MNILIEQGVLGIVIGIITTVIIFVLKGIWTTKITPFIVATRYQGVQVSGKWFGSSENNNPEEGEIFSNEATLFLEQKAHELKGSFIYKYSNDLENFAVLDFDVIGYIWEGYITLNFTPKDKRITSYATSLLKLHDGGALLVGEWLFRDVYAEVVSRSTLSLGRDLQITSR